MITISVSADAFAAITSTLPKGETAVSHPDGKGGFLVTLDPAVLARLKALRGKGEFYSDVILRLANG